MFIYYVVDFKVEVVFWKNFSEFFVGKFYFSKGVFKSGFLLFFYFFE